MKNKILPYLILIPWVCISPSESGNTTPITHVLYPIEVSATSQKAQQIDSLEQVKERLRNELARLASKPKVIYHTRTKTVKPKQITLYVRESDGTITEHKVRSDGGFYIVDASDIIDTNKMQRVEFKYDTAQHKPNFLRRIFKR